MLLEGLLKVGLISLNEQAIEMLLATFVYPMLLQPLLLPGHQYSSASGENKEGIVQLQREEDEKDGEEASAAVEDKNLSSIISLHSSAPFYSILCSTSTSTDDDAATTTTSPNLTQTPNHRQLPAWTRSYNCLDLTPSKTALYCLSLVFRAISNPTFRHLLLVALLHPLSPRATGGRPIVRFRLQVTLSKGGGVSIRTDANQERQSAECGEPSQVEALYSFGTDDSTNTNIDGNDDSSSSGIDNQQVFILAPALVDILRHSCSENAGAREEIKSRSDELIVEIGATMTRPNPYRSVIYFISLLGYKGNPKHFEQ